MTGAERQARYRAAHADGRPKIHYRRSGDRCSRPQRWRDAVAELVNLQEEYRAWLDSLPDALTESATADALRAICDLDLSELESVEPPRGFGRGVRRRYPPRNERPNGLPTRLLGGRQAGPAGRKSVAATDFRVGRGQIHGQAPRPRRKPA
jgi:hypothetical protein